MGLVSLQEGSTSLHSISLHFHSLPFPPLPFRFLLILSLRSNSLVLTFVNVFYACFCFLKATEVPSRKSSYTFFPIIIEKIINNVPRFDHSQYSFTVNELAGTGTVLGQITVSRCISLLCPLLFRTIKLFFFFTFFAPLIPLSPSPSPLFSFFPLLLISFLSSLIFLRSLNLGN